MMAGENAGTAAATADAGGSGDVPAGGLADFDDLVAQDPGPGADDAIPKEPAPGAQEDAAADADDGEPLDPPADDASEAELLHGLKQEDVLAALKEGRLPDELLEHLTITQTIDGKEVPVTLAEARQNGMRLSDYSRKSNQLADDRRQFDGAREDFITMAKSWRSNTPEQRRMTRQMWEEWAGEEVVLEIARDIADERVYVDSLGPQGRTEWEGRRKAEREAREARRQAERAMREAKQKRNDNGSSEMAKQIGMLRDVSFKKLGIKPSAYAQEIYMSHVRGLWNASAKKGPVDPAMSDDAARATLEDLSALRDRMLESESTETKAQAGAQRASGSGPKLAPKPQARGGGSGGGANGAGARPRRGGVSDFTKMFGL